MSMDAETPPLSDLLRRYLWEYNPAQLSWEKGRQTILARLLQIGGWDAVRWLRTNVSDEELREFLVRRRGRGLDPKRLRFWGLVLDLPAEQVDAWIATHRDNPWRRRTRR
jgi:hypothetical protein